MFHIICCLLFSSSPTLWPRVHNNKAKGTNNNMIMTTTNRAVETTRSSVTKGCRNDDSGRQRSANDPHREHNQDSVGFAAANGATHPPVQDWQNHGDNGTLNIRNQEVMMGVNNSGAEDHNNRSEAGVPLTFPQKLMNILEDEASMGIAEWLPHGRGFIILNKKRFGDEIMAKYFKNSKFTSFTRKLNRWSFIRVTRGPEIGAYYHPLFQRDNIRRCMQMACIGSNCSQQIEPMNPVALGLVAPRPAASFSSSSHATAATASAAVVSSGASSTAVEANLANLRQLEEQQRKLEQLLLQQQQLQQQQPHQGISNVAQIPSLQIQSSIHGRQDTEQLQPRQELQQQQHQQLLTLQPIIPDQEQQTNLTPQQPLQSTPVGLDFGMSGSRISGGLEASSAGNSAYLHGMNRNALQIQNNSNAQRYLTTMMMGTAPTMTPNRSPENLEQFIQGLQQQQQQVMVNGGSYSLSQHHQDQQQQQESHKKTTDSCFTGNGAGNNGRTKLDNF